MHTVDHIPAGTKPPDVSQAATYAVHLTAAQIFGFADLVAVLARRTARTLTVPYGRTWLTRLTRSWACCLSRPRRKGTPTSPQYGPASSPTGAWTASR